MRAEQGLRSVPLEPRLRSVAAEVDALFEHMLSDPLDPRNRLYEAMRYAAVDGGKRIRPLLTVASCSLFDVPMTQALRAALAVECVHVHSLIHDDLPCMDDDDLRRGKATVHCASDEATAVLAGDALLALAFEILSDPATHPAGNARTELVRKLAAAAGPAGMAGGQMLDLHPDARIFDLDAIKHLQELKTGKLIGWCLDAGVIMGSASLEARASLQSYARRVGLAFQIADDLLDTGGNEKVVGKRLGKDAKQGKATFVALLGAEQARMEAEMLVAGAIEDLRDFGIRGASLAAIARFVIDRDR